MYNYRGFTCSKDVLIYLDSCKEEQEHVFDKLNNIEIKLFDPNRKELKKERKKLKNQLKLIKGRIRKCVDILEEGSTFNREDFLKFLPKYLSLKEGEVYVLIDEVVADDFYMEVAAKTYPWGLFSEKYNVITTVHNKRKLEDIGDNGSCGGTTDDIEDYLSVCEDGKYLCLSDASLYTLLSGTRLNKIYSAYPYMRELAFDLVDLKIENPYMSDEERLNKILSDLQKKKRFSGNPAN